MQQFKYEVFSGLILYPKRRKIREFGGSRGRLTLFFDSILLCFYSAKKISFRNSPLFSWNWYVIGLIHDMLDVRISFTKLQNQISFIFSMIFPWNKKKWAKPRLRDFTKNTEKFRNDKTNSVYAEKQICTNVAIFYLFLNRFHDWKCRIQPFLNH